MKLSIITINRNNLDGLRKTVESVLSQTWKEFEYIVVDGASTDGSVDYIRENKDLLSYWVSEPDNGVYQAMNKGILQSNGEYLLFLNSGDCLVDKDVLNLVFSKPCIADILCGKCNVVNSDGVIVWTSNPPENITFGFLYHQGLGHQSTFIKRSLFDKIGLYREDFKYNSDIDFWYKSIIIQQCTTAALSIIVANYDNQGISSLECHSNAYKKEMNDILSQSNFLKYLPDYESADKEKEKMSLYYWVDRHKFLKIILMYIYRIALFVKR